MTCESLWLSTDTIDQTVTGNGWYSTGLHVTIPVFGSGSQGNLLIDRPSAPHRYFFAHTPAEDRQSQSGRPSMDEQSDDITFTPEQVEVMVFDIVESVVKDKVRTFNTLQVSSFNCWPLYQCLNRCTTTTLSKDGLMRYVPAFQRI